MQKVLIGLGILVITVLLRLMLQMTTGPGKKEATKTTEVTFEQINEPESNWIETSEEPETHPQAPFPLPVVDTENQPNLLPLEMEEPFFDILDNSKSREERNSRLYLFATTTAQNSPRVQEECLAHLSFGINENEKELALQILKDLRISEAARMLMFNNFQKVRTDEFIFFLASRLSQSMPKSRLTETAQKILNEY